MPTISGLRDRGSSAGGGRLCPRARPGGIETTVPPAPPAARRRRGSRRDLESASAPARGHRAGAPNQAAVIRAKPRRPRAMIWPNSYPCALTGFDGRQSAASSTASPASSAASSTASPAFSAGPSSQAARAAVRGTSTAAHTSRLLNQPMAISSFQRHSGFGSSSSLSLKNIRLSWFVPRLALLQYPATPHPCQY
jgi:hypothetical protein